MERQSVASISGVLGGKNSNETWNGAGRASELTEGPESTKPGARRHTGPAL
jgi:hypothetical protein